jgi:F-type H+-transporting ATPase subunit a
MQYTIRILALVLAASAAAMPAVAAEDGEEFDPVHHVADGYYLDFEPIGHIELPRIFVVRRADGSLGVDVFASSLSAVNSGRYIIGAGHHEPLAETPAESFEVTEQEAEEGNPIEHAEELVVGSTHLESELLPADGGHVIIDLSISRHLVFAILAALIVFLIFTSLAGRYKRGIGRDTAPRGIFHNLFETLVVFVRDEIARPNLGPKYEKFLPYLLTAFFFILTANLIGLVPFGATATSNLMITATLALFTFVVTQINGTKDYWKHIFWPPGVPVAVRPIMVPVEIMGIFTKPIALAIRLFANMTAGHLVILSLIGLIFTFTNLFGSGAGWGVSPVSVAFALFIFLLELLVAFIQAYVFTLLSALFIGMAVEEHHSHEHAHEPEHFGQLGHATVPGDHSHVTPHIMPGTVADNKPPVRERSAAAH